MVGPGHRREWLIGLAMALVLAGVAAVTLALREGEALTPPAAEPPTAIETAGPPIEGHYGFLPVAGAGPPPHFVSQVFLPEESVRITLTWDPAARQATVFCGSEVLGVLGYGALNRCVARCRGLKSAMTRPSAPFRIEIDAAPDLPWEQFVWVFAAVRPLATTPVELTATWFEGAPADLAEEAPRCSWGGVPGILPTTADPVDEHWGRRGALCFCVDLARQTVLRFGAGAEPEAYGVYSLRTLLKAEAGQTTDDAQSAYSRLRVALFLPPDAPWRHAQFLLRECAKVGIWDIAFAVAAAPAAAPAGGGK